MSSSDIGLPLTGSRGFDGVEDGADARLQGATDHGFVWGMQILAGLQVLLEPLLKSVNSGRASHLQIVNVVGENAACVITNRSPL